ncbi:hypothetical protein L3Y34_008459 [Caenorhabditis briggsae]|uniref:Ground-like domain-containing protein n=1 Tax=Caenorhabditis briggsae TaxID=6238 RepID=A0AAE9A2R9_CAEBR|nr:hypothetical protein L3Y34_008459 [Caenorhabditis briggsae]
MWEFILMNEPTGKRVKRASTTHQNRTIHAAHSGGKTFLQPLPLPQRWIPNASHNPPPRHHTLIQPVDSNAPRLPPPQRHVVERQVVPILNPAQIYNANPYSNQPILAQNSKQNYSAYPPPAPPPRNPLPNLYHQNLQQNATGQPAQYQQQSVNTNYNQPPQRRPPQLQVSPPNQAIETNYYTDRNVGKYQSPKNSGRNRNNRRKGKKKKGRANSKMCRLCREMSEEEDSEEKEVACDLCSKSSNRGRGRKKGRKQKTRTKDSSEEDDSDRDEDSPEGEGAQIDDITEDGDGDYYDDEDRTTQKPTTVSQPTIIDFAKRAEQNKLMRIPVYRGKKLENKDAYRTGSGEHGDGDGHREEEEKSEYSSNIREGEKQTKYSSKPNVKYSYPPKDTLPLQTCFHNPSGYVCCNLELNNVVESTYKEVKELSNFNPCNLQLIANKLQRATEKMFGHPFESVVSHADFAQNINFSGDLVCKLEIDGKYMIVYGTPYHADDAVGPQGPDGKPLPVRSLKL